MRVAFIGRSHPFSLEPLRQIATTHEIVAVVESAPATSATRLSRLRRQLATKRKRYRGGGSLPYAARTHRAAYLWLDRTSRPRLKAALERARPDIICIASLGHLLEDDVLAVAPLGAYNLHPSLLPLYRGPFPWFWQYHDFVLDIGVTVHKLEAAEDSGPIVAQAPLKLEVGTDIHVAMSAAGALGGELMWGALEQLGRGAALLTPQDLREAGPRARRVRREERFIDWTSWPLERVWHFMRGTYPWVDHFDGPTLAHGSYRVGDMTYGNPGGPPGELCGDGSGHFVAHPEGRVHIEFT